MVIKKNESRSSQNLKKRKEGGRREGRTYYYVLINIYIKDNEYIIMNKIIKIKNYEF